MLVAAMLCFQAVFHPSAEQAFAQQFEETSEDDECGEGKEPSSLKAQMRRQAKRNRRGDACVCQTLRLSRRDLLGSEENPAKLDCS